MRELRSYLDPEDGDERTSDQRRDQLLAALDGYGERLRDAVHALPLKLRRRFWQRTHGSALWSRW